MFKFSDIVVNILLEVGPSQSSSPASNPPATSNNNNNNNQIPQWLQEIFKKHKEIFYAEPTIETINQIFPVVVKRPSESDVTNNMQYVRILDILTRIYDSIKTDKPKDPIGFLNAIKDPNSEGGKTGISILNSIKNITPDKKQTWDILNGEVRNAWNLARAAADKMGAAALSTYNNQSILETTKQIVAKRIKVFDRLVKLKSPTQPFTNLITDIFKYPEQYIAGQKRVSSDFEQIVDNLYVQNLFKVGLATKEFFGSEIARLKLQSKPEQKQSAPEQMDAETQQLVTTMASLNLFDKYTNAILVNEVGVLPSIARNVVQGVQRGAKILQQGERLARDPQYKQRYERLKQRVKQDAANYMAFLQNKPVEYRELDAQEKETGKTGKTDPRQYTIGRISKLETPEATNLITALRNIAEYVRKRVGAGEMASRLGKAAGALTSGIGPVN